MKRKYVVTGYSHEFKRMVTRVYDNIEIVALTVGHPNPKDLDFNVQSRASHNGAEIIVHDDAVWSVFLMK